MGKGKLKVAIIGTGYWGKNLVRVFHQLGVLDTICDSNSTALKQIGKQCPGAKTTLSYADVLKNKAINAVVISSPAESHYKLVKESLLAGKDVFVEKPLALTTEEGAALVNLAKRDKRILMVGHLLEYHPAVNKLRQLMGKGELGKIQYIYSNRLNLGKIRREENILWSFAPHDISVILFLLNEVPEGVSAFGGNYLHREIADVTISNLTFSSGVKGHIFVSWLHPYKEQKLIVVGDKKMAVFDDVAEKDKLLLFNHKIKWIDRIPVPKKENAERIDLKVEEPLRVECMHFLDCLKTRKTPQTDGESALRVLKVLQACQTSLENEGIAISLKANTRNSPASSDYYAHPTSTIAQPSQISNGTKIWHYSHVMGGAKVGENCTIGQNVFINSGAVVGNNVKVQNNVSIYDRIRLEDDVFCGPSMVFTNVLNPRSHISRKKEFKTTLVKKGATLGANSTIVCGNTIGEYAFVGAGAVVTKDVLPHALVYGNPARQQGWMCQCGIKLEIKDNEAECTSCGDMYVFGSGKLTPAPKRDKVLKK
ncbi:MAG: Gfo/Idh/MocA family oxidoreductase [Candidatus Omnitrophica bacterium]|nr:Gfo/Idh/MocA family oxidoreductase [Candidatus Omnitrophota bacterium]